MSRGLWAAFVLMTGLWLVGDFAGYNRVLISRRADLYIDALLFMLCVVCLVRAGAAPQGDQK